MPRYLHVTLNGGLSQSASGGTAKTGFEDWSNFTACLVNNGTGSTPSYITQLHASLDGTNYVRVGSAAMVSTSTCVLFTVDAILLRAKSFKAVNSEFASGTPMVVLTGSVGD